MSAGAAWGEGPVAIVMRWVSRRRIGETRPPVKPGVERAGCPTSLVSDGIRVIETPAAETTAPPGLENSEVGRPTDAPSEPPAT